RMAGSGTINALDTRALPNEPLFTDGGRDVNVTEFFVALQGPRLDVRRRRVSGMAAFDPTQRAGAELGVHVTAPFEFPVRDRVFRYGALVVGFVTPAGILLRAMPDEFHPDQCGAIWDEATAAGYAAFNLSPLLCH